MRRHADQRSSVSGSRGTRCSLRPALPGVAGAGPTRRAGQEPVLGTGALRRHRRAAVRGGPGRRRGRTGRRHRAAAGRRTAGADRRRHLGRRRDAPPDRRHQLDHGCRAGAAAARPQDRRAGLRPDPARRGGRSGRGLHRGRGEDRLVRRGGLPLPRRRLRRRRHLRRPAVLRAVDRRGRRDRRPGARPVRAAAAAARHPTRRHPAREGRQGHRTGLRHRGRPAGAARHRRRGTVPRPLPRGLAGGPQRGRAQRPDVGADLRDPGAAARRAAAHGGLVRRRARTGRPAGGR